MERPTTAEVKKTLDMYTLLSRFEANHRQLRGWGLIDTSKQELPVPEVVKVEAWLRQEFGIPEEPKSIDPADLEQPDPEAAVVTEERYKHDR